MITKQVEYRKNDVWLWRFCDEIEQITILEVNGQFLRTKYGWISGEEFHKRAQQKLGVARRFLGIQIGVRRCD